MVVVACREVSIYTPDGSKLILGSSGTGNSNNNNNSSAAYTVRTLHSNSSNAIYNLPTSIPTPMPTPVRIPGVYNLTKPATPVGGGGGGGGGSGEEGVNLTVYKGDRILLVGPSGIGKILLYMT